MFGGLTDFVHRLRARAEHEEAQMLESLHRELLTLAERVAALESAAKQPAPQEAALVAETPAPETPAAPQPAAPEASNVQDQSQAG